MKSLKEELLDYVTRLVEGEELSLVNIKNGACIEEFDLALAEVVRNCADINTTLGPREITLKVIVKPTKDRDMVGFKIGVTKKLAGMEPIEGLADVQVDGEGAGHVAIRRTESKQQPLFTNVKPIRKE